METTNYEETVEETTETPEVVEETTEEPTEESEEETTEVDWEARALKAERAIEKSKKKAKDTPKKEEADDAVLSRLETRGVMDADDQNYVLRFAKDNNLTPVDALKDLIVIDRLASNAKARTSVEATPTSNNRANTAQNELDVAVKRYDKDGTLPDNNPALTAKILKKLANRG